MLTLMVVVIQNELNYYYFQNYVGMALNTFFLALDSLTPFRKLW